MSINPYIKAARDAKANADLLTVERFVEDAPRQPGLVACIKIHLKYELLKAEAEQEFLADFLETWAQDASNHPGEDAACDEVLQVGAMRTFQKMQSMKVVPEKFGGGTGYFFECNQDLEKELGKQHNADRGLSWAARIAQANIDAPKVKFGELGASYAEQNAEACQTLLTYCNQ